MTQFTKNEPETSHDFVKRSSLYQEFLAERERLGYDIGFERALLDWIRKHRESWRSARRAQQTGQPGSGKAETSITQNKN
jgi:hypothetical protein